jgi:UDP-GlcNAc:undecaprenyl-phosphate GlcNAc-1-phosphate transferase
MAQLCLFMAMVSALFCWVFTLVCERLGTRAGALDGAGVAGQVKAPARRVPNIGGVAIFWSLAIPMLAVIAGVWLIGDAELSTRVPELAVHLKGLRSETPLALTLLGCLAVLHVVGLIDDRRPLGPWIKMGVMAACAAAVTLTSSTRLLTAVDPHVGGHWLSVVLTVFWIVVITNAMNFIDNMDGLSAGVGMIAGAAFMAAALVNGQWFVAATLALLVGSLAGFLIRNFPPAKIFMGDGGSLVLGFLLAFLTVRTTYYSSSAGTPLAGGWYGVFMPLIVLAVPLYDLASVVLIRVRQGRSPLVGDLQHLSHRLVRRGMSRRSAVLLIWGLTAATAIGGITLGSLHPWQAALVGVQTLLILGVILVLEVATAPYIADDPKAMGPGRREGNGR